MAEVQTSDKVKHVGRETLSGLSDGFGKTVWNGAVIAGLAGSVALMSTGIGLVPGFLLLGVTGALAVGTGVFKGLYEVIKGVGATSDDPLNGVSGLIKGVAALAAATIAGISMVTPGGMTLLPALALAMGVPALVGGALGLIKGLFTTEEGGQKVAAERQLEQNRADNLAMRQTMLENAKANYQSASRMASAHVAPQAQLPAMGMPKGPGMQLT